MKSIDTSMTQFVDAQFGDYVSVQLLDNDVSLRAKDTCLDKSAGVYLDADALDKLIATLQAMRAELG